VISQIVGQSKNSAKSGITSEQAQELVAALQKDYPRYNVPVVLTPTLYPDTEDLATSKNSSDCPPISSDIMENSLAEMIAEVGSGCTAR
jgi:hypothetical protein